MERVHGRYRSLLATMTHVFAIAHCIFPICRVLCFPTSLTKYNYWTKLLSTLTERSIAPTLMRSS